MVKTEKKNWKFLLNFNMNLIISTKKINVVFIKNKNNKKKRKTNSIFEIIPLVLKSPNTDVSAIYHHNFELNQKLHLK